MQQAAATLARKPPLAMSQLVHPGCAKRNTNEVFDVVWEAVLQKFGASQAVNYSKQTQIAPAVLFFDRVLWIVVYDHLGWTAMYNVA